MKNKIYYSTMNKRNYFCIILTILGSILVLLGQVLIPVSLLVLIVTLFDGPLNKDVFVFNDKKTFLLTGNENMKIRTIALVIIFSGFAFCLAKYYMVSLCIFYVLLLCVFLFNLSISKKNIDFIKENDNLVDDKINGYQTFEILKVIDNKSSFTLVLKDKFSKESYEMEYKVSHGFIDYKELYNSLKSFKFDDSLVI